MIPPCPRCGARLVQRHNRATGLPFWGCPAYPRCRGTRPHGGEPQPAAPDPWSSQGQDLATLQQQLRQVTRERDTLQVRYAQVLAEVRQLRRLQTPPARGPGQAPPPDRARLVRELTRLIARCHPDRWGGESAVATALTQELLTVRDRLREGQR